MNAWLEATFVTGLAAVLGLATRAVRPSAAWGGLVVGTLIYRGAGRGGFVVLVTFFVVGVALTRLGYARKAAQGLAEPHGGRRGSAHAVANGGVATLIAIGMMLVPEARDLLAPAFLGAFAAALSDTAGSEVGQLYGRRAMSPLTFRPVPPGTDGAVSLEGTLGGAAAALLIGGVALATRFVGPAGALAGVVGGLVGSLLESVVGSLPGRRRPGHMAMNAANTFVGAAVAAAMAWLLRGMTHG